MWAYAAGTHNGIIRSYNEDRLAIVLNYKLKSDDKAFSCNFFGIYDGHGGVSVADFLKNNLHTQVAPADPDLRLRRLREKAARNHQEDLSQVRRDHPRTVLLAETR